MLPGLNLQPRAAPLFSFPFLLHVETYLISTLPATFLITFFILRTLPSTQMAAVDKQKFRRRYGFPTEGQIFLFPQISDATRFNSQSREPRNFFSRWIEENCKKCFQITRMTQKEKMVGNKKQVTIKMQTFWCKLNSHLSSVTEDICFSFYNRS